MYTEISLLVAHTDVLVCLLISRFFERGGTFLTQLQSLRWSQTQRPTNSCVADLHFEIQPENGHDSSAEFFVVVLTVGFSRTSPPGWLANCWISL